MDNAMLEQDDLWHIGQRILVTDGPFKGMEGVIYLVDRKNQIVRVKISVFGRPTPVELPFSYLKPTD